MNTKAATEAIRRGEAVRLGNTVYEMTQAQYHGRRDDGMFIPIYLDGLADPESSTQMMAAQSSEATSLRHAGHTVL